MNTTIVTCPNCLAQLTGTYCGRCGQKNIGQRLNSRILLSTAFEALTEMDSKLWRTLRELTLSPGQVATNYASGERARYVNPIKYFLAIMTVFLAVMILSGGLEAEISAQFRATNGGESTEGIQLPAWAGAMEDVLREYRNFITFLTLPLFAFLIRWQYWRSKRNYAETLSFVFFAAAHAHLFMIPILMLQWSTANFSQSPRGWFMLAIFFFGAKVFYKMPWIKTIFATVISVGLYSVSSIAAGSVLITLRMSGII